MRCPPNAQKKQRGKNSHFRYYSFKSFKVYCMESASMCHGRHRVSQWAVSTGSVVRFVAQVRERTSQTEMLQMRQVLLSAPVSWPPGHGAERNLRVHALDSAHMGPGPWCGGEPPRPRPWIQHSWLEMLQSILDAIFFLKLSKH